LKPVEKRQQPIQNHHQTQYAGLSPQHSEKNFTHFLATNREGDAVVIQATKSRTERAVRKTHSTRGNQSNPCHSAQFNTIGRRTGN
jgi:hypothetical protein